MGFADSFSINLQKLGYNPYNHGYKTHLCFTDCFTSFSMRGPVWSSGQDASLMHQTRVQHPGATLGGQASHYPTPAVKGMS